MQKTSKLIVIGITSLVIMACSFAGITQQIIEEQPAQVVATTKIPTATEYSPADKIETSIQLEKTLVPTVDPVAEAKSCLSRTWKIAGLSDYVIAAVPPDLADEYDLQYQDTSGQAFFTLAPDGKIIMNAEKLAFLFTAKVSIFEVPVTVLIDGDAFGKYRVDSTTLTTSDMDTSGLKASAQALNENLIEPEQIINSIPFITPPFNTAKYSCQGDTLTLNITGYPENIPPLVFQAVE